MGFPNRSDFSPDFQEIVEPLFRRKGGELPPTRDDIRNFADNLTGESDPINMIDLQFVAERLKNGKIISTRILGQLMSVKPPAAL